MISVVIPAHNEETVLGELLDGLRAGIESGDLEVVVVPNGCSDSTASVARAHSVKVVELSTSNKTSALNEGDAAVSGFPRFYVDADVRLDYQGLEALAAALSDSTIAVSPTRRMDVSESSRMVRAYHRIWDELESTRWSLAGRGCYGVSETGRARWGEFPDLVADDAFVNSRFDSRERLSLDTVHSVVVAPVDVRSLLDRKRRGRRGNLELQRMGVDVTSKTDWLSVVRRDPIRVLDAPAYLSITVISRWLARRDVRNGKTSWGSDRSSRAT